VINSHRKPPTPFWFWAVTTFVTMCGVANPCEPGVVYKNSSSGSEKHDGSTQPKKIVVVRCPRRGGRGSYLTRQITENKPTGKAASTSSFVNPLLGPGF